MVNYIYDIGDKMKSITPIREEIKAKSHTPQYRMHKYFARRPYNVFANLITHYSKPQDIVLDVFCGGGVTVFEGVAQKRRTIGIDINPLAAFITKMQIYTDDIKSTKSVFKKFLQNVELKYGKYYSIDLDNDIGKIE